MMLQLSQWMTVRLSRWSCGLRSLKKTAFCLPASVAVTRWEPHLFFVFIHFDFRRLATLRGGGAAVQVSLL